MLHEDLLARINELANKKKSVGLTEDELEEQKELRQIYLKAFRASFSQVLDGTKIIDEEGNDLTSEKAKKAQREKGLHNRQNENTN